METRVDGQTGDNRLVELTSNIVMLHRTYKKNAQANARNLLQLGQYLIEAQKIVGRGTWGDYIKNKLPFSERTAQDYMRIAAAGFAAEDVAEIGIKGAIEELSREALLKGIAASNPEWRKDFPNVPRRFRPRRRNRGKTASSKSKTKAVSAKSAVDKKFEALQAKWHPIHFSIRRPRKSQVLCLTWPQNDGTTKVAYAWRLFPSGWGVSSAAFVYVLLHVSEFEPTAGEQHTNQYGPEKWEDVRDTLHSFGRGQVPREALLNDPAISELVEHLRLSVQLGGEKFTPEQQREKKEASECRRRHLFARFGKRVDGSKA